MNILKVISRYFLFISAVFLMIVGILYNDTWQTLTGVWMMMYVSELVSKE